MAASASPWASNSTSVPPRKTGRSPACHIKPTHIDISITDQQYHNNLHVYRLVKNMSSALKNNFVAAIEEQWIKGAKDMVMGYAKNPFVNLVDCLYVRY